MESKHISSYIIIIDYNLKLSWTYFFKKGSKQVLQVLRSVLLVEVWTSADL